MGPAEEQPKLCCRKLSSMDCCPRASVVSQVHAILHQQLRFAAWYDAPDFNHCLGTAPDLPTLNLLPQQQCCTHRTAMAALCVSSWRLCGSVCRCQQANGVPAAAATAQQSTLHRSLAAAAAGPGQSAAQWLSRSGGEDMGAEVSRQLRLQPMAVCSNTVAHGPSPTALL